MPWYLYLAFKQLFPTGRKFPFFTFMSALGVGVGVLLLVVSTSIMGGFGQGIRRMIVDTQGEIQIMSSGAIGDVDQLLGQIAQQPGVLAATPYAQANVLLEYQKKPAYSLIQGVDLQRIGGVVPFNRYMVAGRFDDLDDDAIASLRFVQELYGLGQSVHGISVRLRPGVDEFRTATALSGVLPRNFRALTWFESNADFQNIIRFEKYMIFFLLTFIVIVAALSIMSSLTISVVRKTREIGLLGALGGRARDVAICFCAQGFFLGVMGTTAGLGMAWVVLTFRNDIVRILARATVSQEVFQQFYGFVDLPSHTSGAELAVIIVGAVVSATAAGLLPAWRAARLKPVEALRSE